MRKVGLSRYWESNKDEWANTTEKGKAAFEDKWIKIFTDDGVLTIPCPWKAGKAEEAASGAPDTVGDAPKPPTREPGDEPEDDITHRAKNPSVQIIKAQSNPKRLIIVITPGWPYSHKSKLMI